jgi:uncharacterized protein YueI
MKVQEINPAIQEATLFTFRERVITLGLKVV